MWVLAGTQEKQDTNRGADKNTVSLSGTTFEGISQRSCGGMAVSRVTWTEPASNLAPSSILNVRLSEELELSADVNPNCGTNRGPFMATTSGKFSALYAYHREQSMDSISEGARGPKQRFTKTKVVKWRVPVGRPGESMTLEIGGDGPAGAASRLYMYNLVAVSAQQVASIAAVPPPPPPAPTKPMAPAPQPGGRVLAVKLLTDKATCVAGDTTRISAAVEGGKSPYRFMWSGNVAAAAQGKDAVNLAFRKPGEYQIGVRVTDAADLTATDLLVVSVQPLPAELVKDEPLGPTLYLEETGRFHVELPAGTPRPPSPFVFQWRSEPQVLFDPMEGTQAVTTAKFTRPGKVQVWAVLRQDVAGILEKVGESRRIEMEVLPPQLQISISPPEPFVGQETRARVTVTPDVSDINFHWGPLSANAAQVAESPDGRDIRFYLKDDRPARIQVAAETSANGDFLSKAEVGVGAKKYVVRIAAPTIAGPVPQIWKPGVGLVSAGKAIAVHEPLAFRAGVSPAPEVGPLKYEWTADSRNCSISNRATPEALVECSEIGNYKLTVRVRDARGVEFGAAAVAFSVSLSQADLDNARKQASAKKLRDEAFALLKQNKMSEAIARYKECLAVWPNKEVENQVAMLEGEQARLEGARAQARKAKADAAVLEQQGKLKEAIAKYRESLSTQPDVELTKHVVLLEEKFAKLEEVRARAAKLKAEGYGFEQQGSLTEAISRYKQSLNAWPDEPLQKRVWALESQLARQQAQRAQTARLKVEAGTLEQQGKLKEAVAKYKEALALLPDAELKKHVETLSAALAERTGKEEQARKLAAEATALQQSGQAQGALAKLKQSLSFWPNDALTNQVAVLEREVAKRMAEQEARKAQALKLKSEGAALEQQGKAAEAIAKYRESLAIWPDPALTNQVALLASKLAPPPPPPPPPQETAAAKARTLREEGQALQAQGKLEEAAAKYRESLKLAPDKELETQAAALEGRALRAEADKVQAQQMRNEAGALEEFGRFKDAIAKYRESLKLAPDKQLEVRVAALEARAAAPESDQVRARALNEAAYRLQLAGSLQEAIAKYRESLALQPDPQMEAHVAALESELAKQQGGQNEAQELRDEGAALEKDGKFRDATLKYRASLILQPNEETQKHILELEAEVAKQDTAQKLADEAKKLEQRGAMEEAIAKYRESLTIQPDTQLEVHLASLERGLGRQEKVRLRALKLKQDAADLEQQGLLQAALARYKGSLSIQPDPELEAHIKSIEDQLAKLDTDKVFAQARKLRYEAIVLEQQGSLKEAAAKYRESMALQPDRDLEARIAAVEARLTPSEAAAAKAQDLKAQAAAAKAQELRDRAAAAKARELEEQTALARAQVLKDQAAAARAQELRAEASAARAQELKDQVSAARAQELKDEAAALEQQGNVEAAIAKYRGSLASRPDAELEQHVEELEGSVAAAQARQATVEQLRSEASALLRQNSLKEAIAKYRESLALAPDAELERRVALLEADVAKQDADRAQARKLREEGAALEQQGNLKDAIARYRESLRIAPDTQLGGRVAALEIDLARQETTRVRAKKLCDQASALRQQGNLKEAIARFRESLKLLPDAELERQTAALEGELARQEAEQAKLAKLREEGAALEQEGKLKEAIERYRESLGLRADQQLSDKIVALEAELARREALKAQAGVLNDQAAALETRGKLQEAIAKYKESLGVLPDAAVEGRIASLQETLTTREVEKLTARARKVRAEARALEQRGKLKEAIARYRDSLVIQPDTETENQIAALEEALRRQEAEKLAAQARKLRDEGSALEQKGALKDAVAKYRESLGVRPDKELAELVVSLENEIAQQEARKAKARELNDQAAGLAKQGHLDDAMAKYKESLAVQPDPETEKRIASVEEAIRRREAEKLAAQARKLRDEGSALEQQGHLKEAIAKYRESLAVRGDQSLAARAASLEDQLAQQAADKARALELKDRAAALLRDNKLKESIAAYRESLSLVPDEELQTHVTMLEADLAKQEADQAQARKFREEAEALRQQGGFKEAIAKYRESLKLVPDAEVEGKIPALEVELAKQEAEETRAFMLRDEGETLEQQGKVQEAIGKYKESLGIRMNQELADHVAALENELAKKESDRAEAAKLKSQAAALETQGNLKDAIEAYRESLSVLPDPELEGRLAALEAELAKQEAIAAQARKLKDEASALAQEGKLEDAISKYKESLAVQPDPEVSNLIASLEEELKRQEAVQAQAKALKIHNEALDLEHQGEYEAAIARYRELASLRPSPELQSHIAALEHDLGKREETQVSEQAQRLRDEALALEQQGKLKEAAATYRESVNLQPDEETEKRIAALETKLAPAEAAPAPTQAPTQVPSLRDEAVALEQRGQIADAVARYRESLALEPSAEIESHVAMLETQLAAQDSNRQQAQKLKDEARELERQGKLEEAIQGYRDSLSILPEKETEKRIEGLEARLAMSQVNRAQAQELGEQGRILEQEGNLKEAVGLYQRSLSAWPDDQLKAHVQDLQANLAAQATNDARKLRYEAFRAEQQGDLGAALAAFRASLTLVPDPALETRVAALQARLDTREKDRATGERLWQQGLLLVQGHRSDEAIVKLRRSFKYVSSPEREKYVRDLETQIAAGRAPKPAPAPAATAEMPPARVTSAAAPTYPNLAGTAWQGVILIPSAKGTWQWPLQFKVDANNAVGAAYKLMNAATGEYMGFLVTGSYDPASRRFDLKFRRTAGSTSVSGTLTGAADSSGAAGGQAVLASSSAGTIGKGVWRVSPAN
ncbi:MAG: hypothetical protein V1873_02270 [Verrucomicrobiota bacterium]